VDGEVTIMGKRLAAVAAVIAGLACLGLGGGAWAQDVPCQQVIGQAEIGGVLQTITGVACLQSDGTWALVDSSGGYVDPSYYNDSWYWTPYYGYGVIIYDRFHRPHVMHHVFFPHRGVIVHGGFVHGGFHGGGGGHGGSQGGGMHR